MRAESQTCQGDTEDTTATCQGAQPKRQWSAHGPSQGEQHGREESAPCRGRLPATQTSPPPESNICENTKFLPCEVPRAAEFYTSKYKIIQEYTEFLISHAKFTDIPISQRYLDISLNHPITHYHHRFRVSFNACY